jgi:DeoR family transcriptional regulator of aga operon
MTVSFRLWRATSSTRGGDQYRVPRWPALRRGWKMPEVDRQPRAALPAQRRRRIEEVLARRGIVGTEELAALTGVSSVTMRRDLEALMASGVLERTRGGARLVEPKHELDEAFATRERLMTDEKRRIAAATINCLHTGDALGLNDGSTIMQLARRIIDARLKVTVATNALNIALALLESESVEVTAVGGLLRRASFGTYSATDDELASVRFDSVVLGIAGMNPKTGITVNHPFDRVFARRLIDRADRVIVVADSTKWTAGGYTRVAGWDEVDILVTDAPPPQRAMNTSLEVIIADAD